MLYKLSMMVKYNLLRQTKQRLSKMEPLKFNKLLSIWRPKDSNTIIKSELFDRLEKELQQAVKIQNTIMQLKKNVGVV
jgi:hypothetical protein